MPALELPFALCAAAVVAAALVDACIGDLRALRIADRDSWAVLAACALAWLADGADPLVLARHGAAGLAVFAAGAALFARGLWGGGDVKLAAALAVLVGLSGLPRFFLVMALAGGAVALLVLVWRRSAAAPVPYGLAIAAGGLDWLWGALSRHLDI